MVSISAVTDDVIRDAEFHSERLKNAMAQKIKTHVKIIFSQPYEVSGKILLSNLGICEPLQHFNWRIGELRNNFKDSVITRKTVIIGRWLWPEKSCKSDDRGLTVLPTWRLSPTSHQNLGGLIPVHRRDKSVGRRTRTRETFCHRDKQLPSRKVFQSSRRGRNKQWTVPKDWDDSGKRAFGPRTHAQSPDLSLFAGKISRRNGGARNWKWNCTGEWFSCLFDWKSRVRRHGRRMIRRQLERCPRHFRMCNVLACLMSVIRCPMRFHNRFWRFSLLKEWE